MDILFNKNKKTSLTSHISHSRITLGFDEIRNILPQQSPFIFVDRVIELVKASHIVCIKNISGNDPWFVGHFPETAIMPGALILEAMAQAALILFFESSEEENSKLGVFGTVKAKFYKPVFPGDQLVIQVRMDKMISTGGIVQAQAEVDGERTCKATLVFGAVEREDLHRNGI